MKMSNVRKRKIAGWLFAAPWLVGMVLLFSQSLYSLIRYSFTKLTFDSVSGYTFAPLGNLFDNYKEAFMVDTIFPQRLITSLGEMLYRIPVILVFSLFIAIVLNQDFKGRGLARGVFFLPIILSSGVVSSIIKTALTSMSLGTDSSTNIFSPTVLTNALLEYGMPDKLVYTISGMISDVSDLIWSSGVPILIFLMGLLTIPTTYYEVAKVEGATGWEAFWKVTFPVISPYILVNLIYTCIDGFVSFDNSVMQYIMDVAYDNVKYSLSSAMALSYFVIIIVILVAVILLTSLFIPYGIKLGRKKEWN